MESGLSVAVVGGGIIGMSIAWRLAQGGASVTVFDSGRVGNEASWAAAGMLAPGGEFESATESSRFAIESLSVYPDYVEELERESGISIDFRRCGAFSVAFSEGEAEGLRSTADRQNAIGIYSEQFPPSRIPGLRPGAIAAQYFPSDAVVNPRDVLQALRIACLRAGVSLREFSPVREIQFPETIDGTRFDRIVLAAGAWSSQVVIDIAGDSVAMPTAVPVRGHLIAFDEHTGICDAIVRHGSTYLLRRSGNIVVAGASTEHRGFDRTLDGEIVNELAVEARRLAPGLAGLRYVAWNGFRPGTINGDPVIGRLPGASIWLAYGHYRNGILLAPATATRVASEVLTESFKGIDSDLRTTIAHPR